MMKFTTQTLIFSLVLLFVAAANALALSESDFHLVASRYDVPANLLKAIAQVETQGGRVLGDHRVEEVAGAVQVKYLRKIARRLGRPLSEFKGSYAGAMGYMQFMPSTFFMFGQDGDGDGLKDPMNEYDSLATAAYFVAHHMARHDNLTTVLRRYNNCSAYGKKVLSLYRKFENSGTFVQR